MRRLSIIPAGAAGQQEIILYDETKSPFPDACADGFIPQINRRLQTDPEINAAFNPVFDRFNQMVRWSFTVLHTFGTVADCQDFVGQRADTLPGSGELVLYLQNINGVAQRYYKTVFIESHGPVADNGTSVRYRYNLLLNSSYSLTP